MVTTYLNRFYFKHKKLRISSAELEELKRRIAESEKEEAEGIVITHEDVKRMIAEEIASYKIRKGIV